MSGNQYFDNHPSLKWSEELGVGYLPISNDVSPYDDAYIQKYIDMGETDMGKRLTTERLQFVINYAPALSVVDVGVGSGQFMEVADCYGFDVNPTTVKTLVESLRWFNPYFNEVQCATFWDSLEHIHDVHLILANVTEYIFVSLPIFDDLEHVKLSKHFRPDEHCWYFTKSGFERFIAAHGFAVIEYSQIETELGREDIGTFVCKRVS